MSHAEITLPIIPIGINYSHPTRLFSRAWVNVGNPIPTDRFLSLYRINAAQAIRLLANTAWLGVKALVVETNKHHTEQLFTACEMIRSDYPWNQYVAEEIIDNEIETGKKSADWEPALQSAIEDYACRLKILGCRIQVICTIIGKPHIVQHNTVIRV